MKSVNKWFGLGRVGKDPEIRSVGSGTLVASFSMATDSRYKDSSGNWQTKTQWHRLQAWARLAEVVRDYVKKGSQLYVEGEIQYREHEGKYYTDIRVNELSLLDGGQKQERTQVPDYSPFKQPEPAEVSDDDSIPF